MACGVQRGPPMHPFIDVQFHQSAQNASLEAAVHRWIARFELMGHVVARASVAIEPVRRKATRVTLMITLQDQQFAIADTSHADPYVAVSDAFRKARRGLLERAAASTPRRDRSAIMYPDLELA